MYVCVCVCVCVQTFTLISYVGYCNLENKQTKKNIFFTYPAKPNRTNPPPTQTNSLQVYSWTFLCWETNKSQTNKPFIQVELSF